jgi:hypothetical protein
MKRSIVTASLWLGLLGTGSVLAEISYDYLDEIQINGAPIENYNPLFLEYEINIPFHSIPEVAATTANPEGEVFVEQATSLPGTAYIELREGSSTINSYQIHFSTRTEKLLELNFDNDEIGATPDGLKVEGSKPAVVEAPSGAEGRVLHISQVSDESHVQIHFPPQNGTVVVEGFFLLPGTTEDYPILAIANEQAGQNATNDAVALTVEVRDGDFVHSTAEGNHQRLFPAGRENHWYHIKVVADVAAGTADIFIDNWLRGRQVQLANPYDPIDRAIFRASSEAGYYLKNILVYKTLP